MSHDNEDDDVTFVFTFFHYQFASCPLSLHFYLWPHVFRGIVLHFLIFAWLLYPTYYSIGSAAINFKCIPLELIILTSRCIEIGCWSCKSSCSTMSKATPFRRECVLWWRFAWGVGGNVLFWWNRNSTLPEVASNVSSSDTHVNHPNYQPIKKSQLKTTNSNHSITWE